MSLTSTMRPSAATTNRWSPSSGDDLPFHLQPTYLTLHRMLTRYQHNILLQPPSDVLSAFQEQVQRDLRSPLPYQRRKWLHNIEYARTLLLQLEHAAQGLKVQRAKRDAIRDLAEKRTIIKRLRSRVEEIGIEVESMGDAAWEDEGQGETLEEILGRPPLPEDQTPIHSEREGHLENGKPVSSIVEDKTESTIVPPNADSTRSEKHELFGARRRRGNDANDKPNATTSGFSNLENTEKVLLNDSRTHEDLTTSLVSMAAQLKQQARAFQGALELDKGLLDRALEGLDRNVSGMAAASKNMQFLRRMSEGQGWLGRMKLYLMIIGLWTAAILLVFVMPKLRF